MPYAMVVIIEDGRTGPNTVHTELTDLVKEDEDVLYVGRPIEVPRAVEYGTDSLWLRVNGEQVYCKHERQE